MRIPYPILIVIAGVMLALSLLLNACRDGEDPEPPIELRAAFSASPFEGQSPLTVQFTDESTGSPTLWEWDFMDDGIVDAFTSDPSFTYEEPGFYTVRLIAGNDHDADTATILDYIYLNREDILLNYQGTVSAGIKELAEIPVRMGQAAELGAMTIKLFYDNRLIEVKSIEGDMVGLVSSIIHEDGTVIIAWSSVIPLVLAKDEVLFRIKADILTRIEPVSHYLRIVEGTEFADPSAHVLPHMELTVSFLDTKE